MDRLRLTAVRLEGLLPRDREAVSTTGRRRTIVIFLYVLAGWIGLSLLAYFVLLPLLKSLRAE